jgi:heme exporter protein C
MKKHWWKALGVLIIFYTFFAGILTPLKPGILSLEPAIIQAGSTVRFNVVGYNTHFKQTENELNAWLVRRDGRLLPAEQRLIESETTMQLVFQVPLAAAAGQAVDSLQLVIDNPLDGHFQIAVFQNKNQAAASDSSAAWLSLPVALHDNTTRGFPFLNNVYESIRNLYFHVPMWFAMFLIAIAAAVYSGRYLRNPELRRDAQAQALSVIVMVFGALGLITGAIWARNTWGDYWSNDPKQVYTAVGLLIYGAYFVLRASFEDPEKRARIAAVYNIFAFSTLVPLLYVLPKLSADSNHPGTGSNIAFGSQDLDNSMRMVFYPAIIGWTIMGLWLAQLLWRLKNVSTQLEEQ